MRGNEEAGVGGGEGGGGGVVLFQNNRKKVEYVLYGRTQIKLHDCRTHSVINFRLNSVRSISVSCRREAEKLRR